MPSKTFVLDITRLCDNDCIFCIAGGSHPGKDLSLEEVLSRIDSGKLEKGATVILSGGEPALNPCIFEIIPHIKNKGFAVKMITNGRMLSKPSFSKKLVECGLSEILTEIHSHIPEMHDFLTKRQGSFMETCRGIKNFSSYGGSVCVKTMLMRATYKNVPDTIEFICRRMPEAKNITIAGINLQDRAAKNKTLLAVRLADSAPYVEKAIDVAGNFNKPVHLDRIPLCTLSPAYRKYSAKRAAHSTHKEGERHHISKDVPGKCITCILNESCPGPYKSQLDVFGDDEIHPIREPYTAK